MKVHSKARDGRPKRKARESGTFGPSAYLDQVFVRLGKGANGKKIEGDDAKADKGKAGQKEDPKVKEQDQANKDQAQGSEQELNQILADNSQMSANTFLNLLKSKGFQVVKVPMPSEADAGSSNPAALRSNESLKINMPIRFIERSDTAVNIQQVPVTDLATPKAKAIGFTKYKTRLIQEGLGNLGSLFYYPKETLQGMASVFEGKKIMADHPGRMDEQNRPERSVRDILGHFENVHVEESKVDGRAELFGDVCILDSPQFDWARNIMTHAVEFSKKYPDKEFVGLSINAGGDAIDKTIDELLKEAPESARPKLQDAKDKGAEQVRYVTEISDAISCDLVTEAGAGGKVIGFLENDNKPNMEDTKMADEKKPAAPADDAGGDSGDHADKDQDIALIKKAMAKHLGDEHQANDEQMGVAHEAYQSAMEMGMKNEEAAEEAAKHLKMCMHMAKKKEAASKDDGDADDKAKEGDDMPKEGADCADDKSKESDDMKQEAMIKLRAENAQMKESLKKIEVTNHIEKVCKESKRGNEITKAFKDLVKEAKGVQEVDKAWKLFEAGLKTTKENVEASMFDGLVISAEKSVVVAEGKGGLDFSDCTITD